MIYQSDNVAKLQLTEREREVAQQLKQDRPEVYPGTRAILDRAQALVWYDKVTAAMEALCIDRHENPADKIRAFCDLAGVPD